ncbi:TIGR00282 family metallophosphoesterase [Staphylospora marina]|uniref:TIGR00282 family metallophosphoesterase n=1 Tax=Staphylospora marina TaxID=2490858 RepID=UPI000F5B9D26|nr:TIGR00282 family metallophosphoesterase [Staphylospora marina]
MKILMIGDVVGVIGRHVVQDELPRVTEKYRPDVIIANGENSAGNGRGIQRSAVRDLLEAGVRLITLGNHAWSHPEAVDMVRHESHVIRPANFPPGTPGRGYAVIPTPAGPLAVVNVMGRALMEPLRCPFRTVDEILKKIPADCPVLVDFHAETTSEKQALAWYLDGRVSAVIGTHTHVQTADERILPGGTAYLTDVGMTGGYDGVIGVDREAVIRRFLTQMPVRFTVAGGRTQFNAVLVDVDEKTRKARGLKRIRIDEDTSFDG